MADHENPKLSADPADHHKGLIVASAVLAGVSAIIAIGYSWWNQFLILGALGLQLLLTSFAALACLHAIRLRKRFEDAVHAGEKPESSTADEATTKSAWGEETREAAIRDEFQLADATHLRNLHFLFVVLAPTIVIGAVALILVIRGVTGSTAISEAQATAFGFIALAASCVWLVLARTYAALRRDELPDSEALALTFRESQWASVLASIALIGSLLWPPLLTWLPWVLLLWIIAVCFEQVVRSLVAWLKPSRHDPYATVLPTLALRQSIFIRGNPLSSMFDTIEARFGVSFRSSWSIRFVRAAILPILVLVAVLFWGMSCLVMLEPSEMGVRENFGAISGEPLEPGLHLKLPWPFGRVLRFPVKRISTVPVGFTADDENPTILLWSKTHAKEEFSLVLGSGTEAVVIDLLLYFKIREDTEGFLEYVYNFQNPDEALTGFAYRALMEHTRNTTLDEVLSANRAEFAKRLEQTLRGYIDENRLGIDLVQVALMNLHPPVDVAPSYLDVISAEIDADRFEIQAAGAKSVRLQEAARERGTAVATAKVNAARRVGNAREESAQFLAVGEAYSVAPNAFKFRARGDTISQVLSDKNLIVIDKNFAGDEIIDLRPGARSGDPVMTEGR